jgi:hypothetical protein
MQNGLQLKARKEMGIPRASKQTSQEMWRLQSHETSVKNQVHKANRK